jgi:hypothetical protein
VSWENSDRRARLPKDWPKRVAQTKARARGLCQAKTHEPECDGVGRECDHIQRGDNHDLSNLQWLSTPCHKAKTNAEKPTRYRPQQRHPGVI